MSIVVKIEGEVGTGKTSFALTMPKPIVHMDTDVGGFSRAAWRFKAEIDSGAIRSKSYHVPQQALIDSLLHTTKHANKLVGLKKLWYDRMLPDYVAALTDRSVATIVWDSWTQFWPLCNNTYLEELQERNPDRSRLQEVEYSEPNLRMSSVVDAAREADKNLVLICHMTDERKDYISQSTGKRESVVTGNRVAECWRRTDRIVDIIIRTELDGGKVKAKIMQSKLVLDLTGMVYENPEWGMVEKAVKMLRGEE